MILLSGALILAPLAFRRSSLQTPTGAGGVSRIRAFTYFALLGIAFLFIEIPLIQRWILLLGHPTYAFMTVVLTVLAFSSVGSAVARADWLPQRGAVGALVVLGLLTPVVVERIAAGGLGWPLPVRIAVAIGSLVPLAVLMGLPFPLGLAWLEDRAPEFVPWAWAINGCASVVASVLAAILALSYGFTVVLLLGAGAYAGAWIALFGRPGMPIGRHGSVSTDQFSDTFSR